MLIDTILSDRKRTEINGVKVNNVHHVEDVVPFADNLTVFKKFIALRCIRIQYQSETERSLQRIRIHDDHVTTGYLHQCRRDTQQFTNVNYDVFGAFWPSDVEIKCRMDYARRAFVNSRNALTCTNLVFVLGLVYIAVMC